MAETADRAHITTASMNRPSVRSGVMITGTAVVAVTCVMIKPSIAAMENPITALKNACQRIIWCM
jgi:hypothetical protein